MAVKEKGKKDKTVASTTMFPTYRRCHEDHPTLKLGKGEIVGASCVNPRKGAQIYIGFDTGMAKTDTWLPWWPLALRRVREVYFPIRDMSVPTDPESFRSLVKWTVSQLNKGKRIHVGCIGGHGRTGMFLAALLKEMTGEADAISEIRKWYCKKAVETGEQVQFLHKYFGITRADPSHGIPKVPLVSERQIYSTRSHYYYDRGHGWDGDLDT